MEDSFIGNGSYKEDQSISRQVFVIKRNKSRERFQPEKIRASVQKHSVGLGDVDQQLMMDELDTKLYDGISTKEIDDLLIRLAALKIASEPQYGQLAARLLHTSILKEASLEGSTSFSEGVRLCHAQGLLSDTVNDAVQANADRLNDEIDHGRTDFLTYFGLFTLYNRYFLRHPTTRKVLETPQGFFMRVAAGLFPEDVESIVSYYKLFSSLRYLPSTPTLFNSGSPRSQLSSCFLLDSPQDSLESIFERLHEVAQLSKFAGGIGQAYHRIRSEGSLIRGTNGLSNGVVPWLKIQDSSVAAVNQGGRRKGAACIYQATWHADIEAFLELRDNTGDEGRRTHNLNIANWVPDLFMKRVRAGANWSLFDPKTVPELCDLYGEAFEKAYERAERAGLAVKNFPAQVLYARMMRTLAETGNGWMTFSDPSNLKSAQTGEPGQVIHLSNLCTEILEVTSDDQIANCNLGSVNLSEFVTPSGEFDFEALGQTVRLAVRQLDRVIDINFYPLEKARSSNLAWRPIGLGQMGLQDVFFKMGLAFDDPEAAELSTQIAHEIYYYATLESALLAKKFGPCPNWSKTRTAKGKFQFDLWNQRPLDKPRWDALRVLVEEFGQRNSLLIAIAPTATIASIAGCFEAIEPQVSNLFKREVLSGEFLQLNQYLVEELKGLGLWTERVKLKLLEERGSIQKIEEIPEEIRYRYRTVWELSQKVLIDMAAARGPYIDQSQSLNLFVAEPNIGRLSSMYMHAWEKGLKTTYYLRSRPATEIKQVLNQRQDSPQPEEKIIACSLANPEACEACQ